MTRKNNSKLKIDLSLIDRLSKKYATKKSFTPEELNKEYEKTYKK